jgi:hypothetical protein
VRRPLRLKAAMPETCSAVPPTLFSARTPTRCWCRPVQAQLAVRSARLQQALRKSL